MHGYGVVASTASTGPGKRYTGFMSLAICSHCTRTLVNRRSHIVYCSTRCRVAAHRDRKRPKVAAAKRVADYTLEDWRRSWLLQLRQLAERNARSATAWSLEREAELRRILGA